MIALVPALLMDLWVPFTAFAMAMQLWLWRHASKVEAVRSVIARLLRNDHLFETFLAVEAIGFFAVMAISPVASVAMISPGYRVMAAIAPDPVWIGIGICMVFSSVAGLLREDVGLRALGLGLAAIVWLMVGVSILASLPQSMGWVLYIAMSLFAFISYRKLRIWGRT